MINQNCQKNLSIFCNCYNYPDTNLCFNNGILYNEKFPKNILILPSRPRFTHFRFGQNVFMKGVLVSTFSRFSNFPLVRKIETKHKRNSWVERESNKKKRKLIQRQKRKNNLSTIDEFTSIQIVQHIIIYIHIILGNSLSLSTSPNL